MWFTANITVSQSVTRPSVALCLCCAGWSITAVHSLASCSQFHWGNDLVAIFLAWSHSSHQCHAYYASNTGARFSLEHELSFFPTSGEHPSYIVPSHDAGLLCARYVAWWSFLRKCRWFFNPDAIFGFMCHWKCSLRSSNLLLAHLNPDQAKSCTEVG